MEMFVLRSEGIKDGIIKGKYGKHSNEVHQGVPQRSFPLEWNGAPDGTVSFAVVFQDYDDVPDEGFSWLHWLVADIPDYVWRLEENESRENPELIQGKNSWMTPLGNYGLDEGISCFYGGPAPDRDHEYEVRIYALDTSLNLKPGFYYNELLRSMRGHILGEAVLHAVYLA